MATETKTTHADVSRKVQEEHKAQGQALRDRSAKQYADRMKGRPTPTQEECDQAKLGMHPELTPDGSDPDPNLQPVAAAPTATRQMEAGHAAPYQTRQASAAKSE